MLNNIQALRAFAAILVVFFHTFKTATEYKYPVLYFSFIKQWGACGVDIFFVISGFIMLYIQSHKKRFPMPFFKDRFTRIAPLYFTLTLLLALAINISPSSFSQMSYSNEVLIKSLMFVSGFPLLFVGWTLQLEMLFYVIFATSLFSKSLVKSSLITIAITLAFAIFLQPIMAEFILGMGVCWLHLKTKNNQNVALGILILGIVSLCSTIVMNDWVNFLTQSKLSRVILWGIPSSLILYGAVCCKQIGINSIFVKIGNASYSIYLIQIFTLPVFYKLMTKSNLNIENHILAILCVTFTTLSGYLLYVLYEKKITEFVKRL